MKSRIPWALVAVAIWACTPQGEGGDEGPSSGSGAAKGGDPSGGVGGSGATQGQGAAGFVEYTPDEPAAGGTGGLPEGVCDSIAVKPELIEVEVEVPVEVPFEVPYEVEVPVEVPYEIVEEKPTAIYVMLDRSSSMSGSLWTTAVSSMTTFVQDPASDGVQVALQYFPVDGVDYLLGTSCADGTPHDTPAVPMGLLPGNMQPIVDSLNATSPGVLSFTPTEAAIRGLTDYCMSFQSQNPDWNCVGVFVTDGEPTQCNGDITAIAAIAGNAYTTAGVVTFAVGMSGANFAQLDQIAAAGHGDCDPAVNGFQACDVTGGSSAFLKALSAIRQSVTVETRTEYRTETRTETRYETQYETQIQIERTPLTCEYTIPDPPEEETFDKDEVNVEVTLASGSVQQLGRAPSEADCEAAVGGSWYYDDPEVPERILICPETCAVLEADDDPRIDILLGCETQEIVIK